MSTTTGHRRRRLAGRAASSAGCGEKDAFVTRLLCRDGASWLTPGCGGAASGGSSRSLGLPPVSTGLSVGTAVALLLLLIVLVGWYRRCAMLRRLGNTPALEESFDPERPLRSSLKQRRKQRRIQRILRLRRQRVHFNEAVDVNEFMGMSATTLSSTSDGRPDRPGGRGRQGSLYVSPEEQEELDEDADGEDMSGLEVESDSHPETSTEDDKDK